MANCRNSRQRQSTQTTQETAAARAAEDMPMNHYVNAIPIRQDDGDFNCELKELNRILDYQNRILVEILSALERMAGIT